MKIRKVIITVEALTNWPIKDLKQYVKNKLNTDPNLDNPQTFETKQVQINVVKK
jgi:hypothetical protein